MRSSLCTTVVLASILPARLSAQTPLIDYHQHLFSPAAAALVTGNPDSRGISALDIIALLDSAGIQRALVLSVAYTSARQAGRRSITNTSTSGLRTTGRHSKPVSIRTGCVPSAASIRSSLTRLRSWRAAAKTESCTMV